MKQYLIHKKSAMITAIAVSLIMIAGWIFSVVTTGVGTGATWVSLFLILIISALMWIKIKVHPYIGLGISIVSSVICFYLLEAFSHSTFDMSMKVQVVNILFYVFIFIVMTGISGNTGTGAALTLVIVMIIGLINYYTVAFRNSPILPWDLLSVKTALSITGQFKFTLPAVYFQNCLYFIFLAVLAVKTGVSIKGWIKQIVTVAIGIVLFIGGTIGIQTDKATTYFQFDTALFTPLDLYSHNGFMASFVINLQFLQTDKPEGYSLEAVEQITEKYTTSVNTSKTPNIVVVMNESFCDLGVLADFDTNEDYMPFFHNAAKGMNNTVSGNLYASVCGGNTPNSEFEFLTGNTMAFLPTGSIPYQQYITASLPNMAQWTASMNYETVAMHPYASSGWKRNTIYPLLGFNEAVFEDQMVGAEMLREYISDAGSYDVIRQIFNNKENGPMFLFDVTMQNHGGYFQSYTNFNQEIELLGVSKSADKNSADQYLSLIKVSDQSFEALTQYFATYDEPTVVVMFGDHQPGDYAIRSIYEPESNRSLEEIQNRYKVPFIIWANYDIEESYVEQMSINYFSTLVMETAGVSLTPYQQFLKELYEKVPVINANGIIDAEGNYYGTGEETPYDALLNEYRILQYNMLFDEDNRQDEFFGFQ